MRTMRVLIVASLLTVIGLAVFWYKVTVLEFPLRPDETYDSWYIETSLHLKGGLPWRRTDSSAIIELQLPTGSERMAIVDENFVVRGFGYEISEAKESGNRQVTFSKRSIGTAEQIFYRAILYRLDSPSIATPAHKPQARSPYSIEDLSDRNTEDDPLILAMASVIDEAKSRSANEATFIREIYRFAQDRKDDRIRLIIGSVDQVDNAPAMTSLLANTYGIPARIVHGVRLGEESRSADLVSWVEYYNKEDNRWRSIDPESGQLGLRGNYLVWWYGDQPLYRAHGVKDVRVNISVKRNTDSALTRAIWKSSETASPLLRFSLFNLPIESQLMFKLLLLVPIGGLIVSVLRQIIGLKTFGTFMPVLVSLAFLETGLVTGVIFFTMIIAIGLFIRAYFDKLQLLLVPRLASVLTIVVLIIALLTLMANNMGFLTGLTLSLFPIVIMTMTIERMSLIWEEHGPKDALKAGGGSMLAAILAYGIMSDEIVGHILFTFPELLLIVLGLTMLIGRYTGYKLTEYTRFRALQRQIEEARHGDAGKA